MRPYFVTATGTDVGKTYITCALIRALRHAGSAVKAIKPVISGFDPKAASTSDSGLILAALGQSADYAAIEAISPWRYSAALSPDMAAEREGRLVPFDEIVRFCIEAARRGTGLCLIEGVGGVMSPVDGKRTNLELIAALDAVPLVIAGSYLGTISHLLTALEALRARSLVPAAVIISESEASPIALDELAARLAHFAPVPVFTVPRGGGASTTLIDLIASMA